MDPKVFWISAFVKMFVIVFGLVNLGAILLWVERRQSAMMQDRMGPNRASVRLFGHDFRVAGLLHSAADGIKMIFKEDFMPPNADRVLFRMAPLVSMIPPLCLFAVIPFGPTLYWANHGHIFGITDEMLHANVHHAYDALVNLDASGMVESLRVVPWDASVVGIPIQIDVADSGILVIFALASAGVLGAALAGGASDNKYSLMGGLRAASQMVSYEVTMGLSLVGAFMVFQTVRLEQMVTWQMTHVWGIFVQPVAFFLFFAAAIAETKRVPFDAPEGESEIVGGYFTEYSGMKFGMFALGELVEVCTSSALLVTIFLGGWQFPFLQNDGFHFHYFGIDADIFLSHLAVWIVGMVTFLLKVGTMVFAQMTIRWTLPRFRYDQIMKLGWRMLLPASLLNIFATGVILLLVNGATR